MELAKLAKFGERGGMGAIAATLCLLLAGRPCFAETAFLIGDVSEVVYEEGYSQPGIKWGHPRDRRWGPIACQNLADALSKVAAKKIGVAREDRQKATGGVKIFVGDTKAARAEGLDAKPLKRGEFRIVTKPGKAFILSNTGMAANYGVAEFLQRYADYWFCLISGDDPYEVAPEREVPVADFAAKHVIYARHYNCWGKRYAKTCQTTGAGFTIRARCRSWFELEPEERVSWLPGKCHTFFAYCQPEKYAKDHPEYFSMGSDGLRHTKANSGSQLCLTNPDVFEIVYSNLCAFVEKDRAELGEDAPHIYDFSQMDNCDYICLCPECRKVIAKYDRKGGHKDGGDAGLQLEFVNRLARKVREKYPDVVVRTFAYVSTEEPPKGIVPEENVMIWLCDLYSKSDSQLPLTHPFNRRRCELIREWAKISKHMEVWDYYLCGGIDVSVDAIAADVRLFRDLGIDRVYNETFYSNQPFYTLNYFVTAELYRNPDRDLEELVNIWCRRYGQGAADMKKAIDFLRAITLANPPRNAVCWHSGNLPYKTAENMEKFLSMMRVAYAKEGEGFPRGRIAHAMAVTCRELMTIYRRTPGSGARYAAVRADYLKYAPEGFEFSDLAPREKTREVANYAKALELAELRFDDLPAVFKGVPDDQMHCLDYRRARVSKAKAQQVADGVSKCAKTLQWLPAADRKPPYTARLIDEELRTCVSWDFTPIADGAYHWIRIGVGRIHRDSWIGFPFDNSLSFRMPHLYVECDGMPEDPNWYEFWVSCRMDGAAKNDDPKKGLFFDRLAMRRVPRSAAKSSKGRLTEARDDDVFK